MRYITTIVEQLDRASVELANDHPINNRLALILIDNATELILHRQCTDRLERDTLMSGLQKALKATKDSLPEVVSGLSDDDFEVIMKHRQRALARGEYLDGKLKVLEQLGDLTRTERRFIKIAHHYRNDLYHVGLKHDDIIRAMAGHYFLVCCDLFTRMGDLAPSRPVFSPRDEYTEVARRYLQMQDGRVAFGSVDKEVLAEKLRAALPTEIPNLPENLAHSARKAIGEVVDDFEFLVRGNLFGFDGDEVLEAAQWEFEIQEALAQEDIFGLSHDPNYKKSVNRVVKTLATNWRPRCRSLPHEKWRARADAIEGHSDPLIAMDQFQSLRSDMSILEESLRHLALELDRLIQMEVDHTR